MEREPWIVRYTPRNVHVVFAGGGFAPIRGSRIGKRPVAIPGARKSGIGKSAPNGTKEMGIISGPTIFRRSLSLNPQRPRSKAA